MAEPVIDIEAALEQIAQVRTRAVAEARMRSDAPMTAVVALGSLIADEMRESVSEWSGEEAGVAMIVMATMLGGLVTAHGLDAPALVNIMTMAGERLVVAAREEADRG